MLTKRIIPCLDVTDGRVVKGLRFVRLRDAGDPVALARFYYEEGADELVFLDISASAEERKTMAEVAKKVAQQIFIPFTIGGGIRTLDDIGRLLQAGADKVSINTAAVKNPNLIARAARRFGSQAIVVAIDAKRKGNQWVVCTCGGRKETRLDAIRWAKEATAQGAGEILLTSIDRDGTRTGFDLRLTRAVANAVCVPVIASGGAGSKKDFLDVFQKTRVSAALAAGLFHYRKMRIPELKKYLKRNEVTVRET